MKKIRGLEGGDCLPIVLGKLSDPFFGQFVPQVIALPRPIQTEFLVSNGPGPANGFIVEAFLGHGKLVVRPLLPEPSLAQ